jgi:hypothetical protein
VEQQVKQEEWNKSSKSRATIQIGVEQQIEQEEQSKMSNKNKTSQAREVKQVEQNKAINRARVEQ